jgi:choline kinase
MTNEYTQENGLLTSPIEGNINNKIGCASFAKNVLKQFYSDNGYGFTLNIIDDKNFKQRAAVVLDSIYRSPCYESAMNAAKSIPILKDEQHIEPQEDCKSSNKRKVI